MFGAIPSYFFKYACFNNAYDVYIDRFKLVKYFVSQFKCIVNKVRDDKVTLLRLMK